MNHGFHDTLLGFQAMLERDCWPSPWVQVTMWGGLAVFTLYMIFAAQCLRVAWLRGRRAELAMWGLLTVVFAWCSGTYLLRAIGVHIMPTQDLQAVQVAGMVLLMVALVPAMWWATPSLVAQAKKVTQAEVAQARVQQLEHALSRVARGWGADDVSASDSRMGLLRVDEHGVIRKVLGGGAERAWRDQPLWSDRTWEAHRKAMQGEHDDYVDTDDGWVYTVHTAPLYDVDGTPIGMRLQYMRRKQ